MSKPNHNFQGQQVFIKRSVMFVSILHQFNIENNSRSTLNLERLQFTGVGWNFSNNVYVVL